MGATAGDGWMQDGWERAREGQRRADAAQTVTFILIAGAVMLFTTFTASYLVRRESADWAPVTLPRVVWANTAVIALSSLTMELARKGRGASAAKWLWGTIGLGVLFAAGQIVAWREMARDGVFLQTAPHASFFYMLTGVHAAHLAAGVAVLFWALGRAGKGSLGPCAAWWHFVGIAWVWVAVLLTAF